MFSSITRSRILLQYGCRVRHASGYAKKSDPAKTSPPSLDSERMKRFMQMAESNVLGFDPWGQPMPILDLHVPTPWSSFPKDASIRDRLKFMRLGFENKVSNLVAMFRIAKTHSLPWSPAVSPYSIQIFRTSSVKPGTWLEPLRNIALDSYERINMAVATNDIGVIRKLSNGAYQKQLLARTKSLHSTLSSSSKKTSRVSHVWRLHSLASPVQCVSIRGAQGHFGRTEPSLGTRWVVQACMRFDTWQSLSILSGPSSSPSEPKRVLEYLVLEKRMWYDEPWMVRDQLWEGVLGQYEAPQF